MHDKSLTGLCKICMGKLFGTDGVRGLANIDITANFAFNLAKAGARVLAGKNCHKPKVLIGADTRISSDMLVSAMEAGLCAMGAEVIRANTITTPAVAYLIKYYDCDAGISISASHNSYEYNGIKFFDKNGYKLDDEIENEIEALLESGNYINLKTHDSIGSIIKDLDCKGQYISFLKDKVKVDIRKIKVLLDCANGAASHIAPEVFRQLGCQVEVINNKPNGININDQCGSTYIKALSQEIKKGDFDIGFAYDGDADRVIGVDSLGRELNGDVLMALLALYYNRLGLLNKNTLVVTSLSNLAMDLFAKKEGISLVKTNVGDRYVAEKMIEEGFTLGGEQSGHIISMPPSTTGDGILASLIICQALIELDLKSKDIFEIINPFPQLMINVEIDETLKKEICSKEDICILLQSIQADLGEKGRIILRVSGTEPVIRVMVEGEDEDHVKESAHKMADLIKSYK